MTALRKIFCGEEIRKGMEGVGAAQILRIVQEHKIDDNASPFAQVLGFHLLAEPQRESGKRSGYRKKKGR